MAVQRRLTFVSGSSAKFWEVSQDGSELAIRYGRLGAAGQDQVKSFSSAQAATEAAEKLIGEKIRKGYAEDATGPAPAVAAESTPDTPAAEPATADEDSFTMPAGWRRSVHPRRGGVPVTRKRPDAGAPAIVAREVEAHRSWVLGCMALERSDRELEQAGTAYLNGAADAAPLGAAVLAAALAPRLNWDDTTTLPALADTWLIERGLPFAAQAVAELNALRCGAANHYQAHGPVGQLRRLTDRERPAGWLSWPRTGLALRVRAAVAAASDEAYAEVVAALAQSREHGPHQRMATSFLAPSETAWVDADCAEAVQVNPEFADGLVTAVSTPEQAGQILKHLSRSYPTGLPALLASVVDGLGPAVAVPMLASWCDTAYGADDQRRILSMLAELPTDEAMAALLDRLEHRYTQPAMLQAAARCPRRAMRLLSERTGKVAEELLRAHVLGHPHLAAEVAAQVSPAAAARISAIGDAAATTVTAPAEALPAVLADPPWTRRRAPRRPVVIEGLACADAPAVVWLPGEREQWAAHHTQHASSVDTARGDSWETVAAHLAGVGQGHAYWWQQIALFLVGPMELAEPLIERWRPADLWDAGDWLRGVMARFELKALPMALDASRRAAAQSVPLLVPFTSPQVAAVMADGLARLKTVRPYALAWLARHPDAAARALVPPALSKSGVSRRQAEQALAVLGRSGHRDAVVRAAEGYGPAARAAIDELLAEDPLDALPAKLPVLPEWTDPALLAPVQLRSGAGALPAVAARHLLTMLAVSQPGEAYAGIELVKQACDGRSLAEFAWALFARWQTVGFPAKEGWVMNALGLLGDDDTVRRLAPLIRAWPGDGGHNRAVAGLDVLAAIGSDTALMHLHAIAEKVKFAGLKERARQKMGDVATQLGLTAAQLADRLVPDFGLAADGSLTLDYGRRQFVVGFDEQLKPYVADADGKRRSDLPKPGVADDPELAPDAHRRFAGLKKDVRTIAADTIRRLEQAMVTRRRWSADEFNRLLVGHPLLWHIVRRLVWARYDESGALTGALRVAEDRTFADVADEVLTLPGDAVVGVAHPLELGDELAGWAEVFADYEILQPFPQLGREVFVLSEAERQATSITRFAAAKIPTGRVVGLERRGWRRGAPQDAGHQGWLERDVPGNRIVVVDLDPGIAIGYLDMYPEQSLERVWVKGPGDSYWRSQDTAPFDVLDPITASEILRDLEEITR